MKGLALCVFNNTPTNINVQTKTMCRQPLNWANGVLRMAPCRIHEVISTFCVVSHRNYFRNQRKYFRAFYISSKSEELEASVNLFLWEPRSDFYDYQSHGYNYRQKYIFSPSINYPPVLGWDWNKPSTPFL